MLNITNYLSWFEIIAIFSLVMGILLSIHTISYLEKEEVDFEISKTIIEHWYNRGRELEKNTENTIICLDSFPEENEKQRIKGRLDDIQKNVKTFINQRKNDLDDKSIKNISMSYTEIKALLNNYEQTKITLIGYRRSLCHYKIIHEKDIWLLNESSCETK